MPSIDAVSAVRAAVRHLVRDRSPLVLAVSGGRDSMCLLHAVAAESPRDVSVATFDHGTGPAAHQAAQHVVAAATACRLPVLVGRATSPGASEASWRAARWEFLRRVARERGAEVVTAHHRDDLLETLVMRLLRGARAWGLAVFPSGVPTRGPAVRRPFLAVKRSDLEVYAERLAVSWVDDPTNRDPSFLRNRVRRDLLPALERAAPTFGSDLLRLGESAVHLRARLHGVADTFVRGCTAGMVEVDPVFLTWEAPSREVLWPPILERAGVVLDRRGHEALRRAGEMRPGTSLQLSGNVSLSRTGQALWVHRRLRGWPPAHLPSEVARVPVGPWSFSVREAAHAAETWDAWVWRLGPEEAIVRPWRPSDRWKGPGCREGRLVARFLAEAGIPASAREGWPVVEVSGEIVWVPGTRRFPAPSISSGGLTRTIRCEFIDR